MMNIKTTTETEITQRAIEILAKFKSLTDEELARKLSTDKETEQEFKYIHNFLWGAINE